MEAFRKKAANFWFYHQKHLLIGLGALVCVLWMVLQAASAKQPDYQIGIVCSRQLPWETLDRIQAAVSDAGADRNGDGEILVQLNTYWIQLGENNQDFDRVQALDADLVGNVSGIFLLEDPDAFSRAANTLPLETGGTLEELTVCLRGDAAEGYDALFSKLGN